MSEIDWNRFKGEWIKFDRPQVVEGVVTHIGIGTFKEATFPELTLRTADGDRRVSASTTQLQRGLADDPPVVGDRVRIEYLGESDTAKAGYSPTKKFTVTVTHGTAAGVAPTDLV